MLTGGAHKIHETVICSRKRIIHIIAFAVIIYIFIAFVSIFKNKTTLHTSSSVTIWENGKTRLTTTGIPLEEQGYLPKTQNQTKAFTEKHNQEFDREITTKKYEANKCQPLKHVFYLKTQKCASSTIAALLTRYGFTNDLSFVLPPLNGYEIYVNRIPTTVRTPSSKYDMLTRHSHIAEIEQLRQLMHADTVWITSIRDPVNHFESMFSFGKWDGKLHKSLQEVLSDPSKIPLSLINKMSRYLGLWNYNEKINSNFTYEADKMFDLVLLVEYLDESLILLQHRLCWALDDIIGLKMKMRKEDVRTELSEKEKEVIRSLNAIDLKLFEHFLSIHKLEVENFGIERMANEVKNLQNRRKEIENICGFTNRNGTRGTMYHGFVKSEKQKSSRVNCHLMTLDVGRLSKLIHYKQEKNIRQGLLT